MTLEQLRIFIAVAERQHMTRAAEALGLTQSAVSAAIAALEARYETALFHRIGRGIELTASGRIFLDEARAVVARACAAELALVELGSLKRGTLLIQASQTIASYWLPRHLVAFRRAFPDIEIRLTIGNSTQVAKAIAAGVAELGFIEGEVDEAAMTAEEIDQDELVVVVASGHPWADHDDLAPSMLTQSDWVLREPGSGTRSVFESALRALGVAPEQLRITLELPSNEAVCAAVLAGAGATAISALVAEPGLGAGTLCRVGPALPRRAFRVVWHRERYRSKAAQALLAQIKEARRLRTVAAPVKSADENRVVPAR
ncbi:MAG: LysR family transcriptional regulator [Azospirillaceae bacterium]|nr:LysR family transcriptional regulator [Azospirillaceae bacterium]